jgi:hypothetical protein
MHGMKYISSFLIIMPYEFISYCTVNNQAQTNAIEFCYRIFVTLHVVPTSRQKRIHIKNALSEVQGGNISDSSESNVLVV